MIHRGTYDGTIYHNPVNRFCIISVKTADKEVPQEARSTRRYKDHLIRFVATGYELPRTDAVELELDGEWTKGKYGVQLQVEQWREIVPKTRDGVEGYLASGLIKGIGPATAAQIVSRFGVETLDIRLENNSPCHPKMKSSAFCEKYAKKTAIRTKNSRAIMPASANWSPGIAVPCCPGSRLSAVLHLRTAIIRVRIFLWVRF